MFFKRIFYFCLLIWVFVFLLGCVFALWSLLVLFVAFLWFLVVFGAFFVRAYSFRKKTIKSLKLSKYPHLYYYYQPVPDRFINLPCARGQRKKCEAICHALCGSRKHKDSIPKNIEKNTILALFATSISC